MAQNLDSMGAVVPISSTTPALPAQLCRLATDAAQMAYGEHRTAPSWAIQQAKTHLPSIDAQLSGGSRESRVTILERLADHTATPDALKSSDAKRIAAFWGAYHADLGHVPTAVLSRACGQWRRSGERFYPTSGQLMKLCRDDAEWQDALTLRKGLDRIACALPSEGDNFGAPDRAEAEQSLRDYIAGLKLRAAQGAETGGQGDRDFIKRIGETGSIRLAMGAK